MRNDRILVLVLLGILLVLPFTVTADRSDTERIRVVYPDHSERFKTDANTVEEALKQRGVKVSDYEQTFPSLKSRIVDGLTVFLYEKASLSTHEEIEGDPSTSIRTVYTHSLPKGRRLVVRGSTHSRRVSIRAFESTDAKVVYQGGPEYKADQVADLVDEGSMAMLATGYSAHPASTAPFDDGVSALGMPAGYGLAAVDPDVIPLGTRLYVENYGYAIAADVGGGIDGRQIDLCFDSHQDALQFGRRWVKVHILG